MIELPSRGCSLISLFAQAEEGKILLAGALADPVDSALFIWKDASPEVSMCVAIQGATGPPA